MNSFEISLQKRRRKLHYFAVGQVLVEICGVLCFISLFVWQNIPWFALLPMVIFVAATLLSLLFRGFFKLLWKLISRLS